MSRIIAGLSLIARLPVIYSFHDGITVQYRRAGGRFVRLYLRTPTRVFARLDLNR